MIGYQAGYQSRMNQYTNMVGELAGAHSSGVEYSNIIGFEAGSRSNGHTSTIMLGHAAGLLSSGLSDSILIGTDAGTQALGFRTAAGGHIIAIGNDAGLLSSGNKETIAIGYGAGKSSIHNEGSTFIGIDAGATSSGNQDVVAIGTQAGPKFDSPNSVWIGSYAGDSSNLNSPSGGAASVNIGPYAGHRTNSSSASSKKSHPGYAILIGPNAGRDAYEVADGAIRIGVGAGYWESGVAQFADSVPGYESLTSYKSNIMMGDNAGAHSHGVWQSMFVGNRAGYQANRFGVKMALADENSLNLARRIIALGYRAGQLVQTGNENSTAGVYPYYGIQTISDTILIGTDAGMEATGINNTIAIGQGAGQESDGLQDSIAIGHQAAYAVTGVTYSPNRVLPFKSIFIGYQAGKEAKNADHCLFIGENAGKEMGEDSPIHGAHGYNASILANAEGDKIHNEDSSRKEQFNLFNTIWGQHGVTTQGRRVVIGDVDSEAGFSPHATLITKPLNTATPSFHASGPETATSVSGPAGVAMITSYCVSNLLASNTVVNQRPSHAAVQGAVGLNANYIVNQNGFLTIPIFTNASMLKAVIVPSTTNVGCIAGYYSYSALYWAICDKNGTWRRMIDQVSIAV